MVRIEDLRLRLKEAAYLLKELALQGTPARLDVKPL
jgi:hypothetical protein